LNVTVFTVSSLLNTQAKVTSLPEFTQISGQPPLSQDSRQMRPVNHIRMGNTFKLKLGIICYQDIQAELYLRF